MKKIALIGVILLAWAGVVQAQLMPTQPFTEGQHYIKLAQATSARKTNGVSVTEIFSYMCHACNDFEPYIQNWKNKQLSDVELNRIPVGFGRPAWELIANGYLIAEIMGIADGAHLSLMNTIWKEGKQMRSMQDLADFYAGQGADKEKYLALDKSFMLNMRQKQNNEKLGIYAPRGTPTMIVNGTYKIQTSEAVPNYDVLLSVVDFLVAKERAENTSASVESSSAEVVAETSSK
ncbi:MAG: thiol:disulfide interchange protein DsbA [Lysobacterales bacterium]|jgi:thiol:disulfide interchange protein DsbA